MCLLWRISTLKYKRSLYIWKHRQAKLFSTRTVLRAPNSETQSNRFPHGEIQTSMFNFQWIIKSRVWLSWFPFKETQHNQTPISQSIL
jgi:hypothetical protein